MRLTKEGLGVDLVETRRTMFALEGINPQFVESSELEYSCLTTDHQRNKDEQKHNKPDQFPGVRFGGVDEMFDHHWA